MQHEKPENKTTKTQKRQGEVAQCSRRTVHSCPPPPARAHSARAHCSLGSGGRTTSGALWPRHGCHGSRVAGRPPTLRAKLAAPGRPRNAASMSEGTADLASETVRRLGSEGGRTHGGSQLRQADCYRTRASPGRRPPPCPRQQPVAPACARGGHCFQEASGTVPTRACCGSEAAAGW